MSSEMKIRRKKRRRTSQIYSTEKPSIYVILGCLAIGVSLLVYFWNPYNQVTSPLPPQSEASLTNDTLPNSPPVQRPVSESPTPVYTNEKPIPAPTAVEPSVQGELGPAVPASNSSPETNAAPSSTR